MTNKQNEQQQPNRNPSQQPGKPQQGQERGIPKQPQQAQQDPSRNPSQPGKQPQQNQNQQAIRKDAPVANRQGGMKDDPTSR